MRDLADFADPGRVRRVAIAIALLAVGYFVVQQLLSAPTGPVVLADFNRAGLNIRAGDEVRVRGVPVGSVDDIVINDQDLSARYHLRLDPGTRVAADSRARIVPKTLLGDKYVELDAAAPGAPTLADGAVIPRDRTASVSELETVLDELGVLVDSVDAVALGSSIAALAAALDDGEALGEATSGFATMAEVAVSGREDIQRILAAIPPAATTFADNADTFGQLAEDLSSVTVLAAERERELSDALRENAELLRRANDQLVSDPRFDATIRDGLAVLAIVAQHPGALEEYLKGVPVYLEGVNNATFFDTLYAQVPHVLLALPQVDARGDLEGNQSGRGPGPDIVIEWDDPRDELGVPGQAATEEPPGGGPSGGGDDR